MGNFVMGKPWIQSASGSQRFQFLNATVFLGAGNLSARACNASKLDYRTQWLCSLEYNFSQFECVPLGNSRNSTILSVILTMKKLVSAPKLIPLPLYSWIPANPTSAPSWGISFRNSSVVALLTAGSRSRGVSVLCIYARSGISQQIKLLWKISGNHCD